MKNTTTKGWKGSINFAFYMALGFGFLLIVSAASITFGAADMRIATAWEAVFQFNPELTEHQIIQTLRLPRTVADLMVGCSLAICGAIMQGTTRNPLADSGLMGISSGSTFAMATLYGIFAHADLRTDHAVCMYGCCCHNGNDIFYCIHGKRRNDAPAPCFWPGFQSPCCLAHSASIFPSNIIWDMPCLLDSRRNGGG